MQKTPKNPQLNFPFNPNSKWHETTKITDKWPQLHFILPKNSIGKFFKPKEIKCLRPKALCHSVAVIESMSKMFCSKATSS